MRFFITGRLYVKIVSILVVGIAGIFFFGASVRAASGSDATPSRQQAHTLQREIAHKI